MPQITTGCPSCKRYFACDEFLVGTRVACPHCGDRFEVRPFERALPAQPMRPTRRYVLALGIAASAVLAASFCALWLSIAPLAMPVEPNPLRVGETGFLSVARQDSIWLGVDEQSVTDWFRCSAEQDQPRLKELMDKGMVFLASKNCRATLKETGPLICRVRLQDGIHRGRDAWVAPIFLFRTRQ